ncbi:MAG: heme biosynthesis HemY N-terminal domain-containing protein [Rhodospirillales bacterium]
MIKALRFLVFLALVIAAVLWLTDNPGEIRAQWRGYQIETSAALMIAVVAVLMAVSAGLYRAWIVLRNTPGNLASAWRERRRRRGYDALTRGMVAVAAGDPSEAQKHSKRAEVLLNEPPLTMLLSAQAAQLSGDDKAAEGFFKAMSERSETEFLGLRGLLSQALAKGDRDKALELARRAYRLRPNSEWVATTLFDLQAQSGQWLDASVTNDELGRRRLVDRTTADRRKGVLAFEQARQARANGDPASEFKHLRQAHDLAPDLTPAAARLAHLLAADGKDRRAAGLIEKAWISAPHPDLVVEYLTARRAEDALAAVKALEKLARANPDHPESHLALAQAAVDAGLWGEARKHLDLVLADGGDDGYAGRALRLQAQVAENEQEDPVQGREWLLRAATAGPDNAWVCGTCGNATAQWTVTCANCGQFDGYAWRTPPHTGPLSSGGGDIAGDGWLAGGTARLPAPDTGDKG